MKNGQWRRLDYRDIPDFPVLDLEYLKDLTVGIYKVNLVRSYIQDKVLRENDEEFQLDEHINEPGFLRIRVYSRFRNATRHQTFISYRNIDVEGMNNVNDTDDDLISGYYYTYQSGARTVGTCAHVTSILWFLGYARHQENIKYPDTSLLNTTLDAANREYQVNLQNVNIEVIDD